MQVIAAPGCHEQSSCFGSCCGKKFSRSACRKKTCGNAEEAYLEIPGIFRRCLTKTPERTVELLVAGAWDGSVESLFQKGISKL